VRAAGRQIGNAIRQAPRWLRDVTLTQVRAVFGNSFRQQERVMMKTRGKLRHMLDALDEAMPGVINANLDDRDFWPAFHLLADPIQDGAGFNDYIWVLNQINDIQFKHNKLAPLPVVVRAYLSTPR
jgi:hypothetical protein